MKGLFTAFKVSIEKASYKLQKCVEKKNDFRRNTFKVFFIIQKIRAYFSYKIRNWLL